MKKEKLFILHETGAPRHFESIGYLNQRTNYYSKLVSVEFSIVRQLLKGIYRKNFNLVRKSICNLMYLIYFLVSKNKQIIIGAAPYDSIIWYLLILKKRHNVIYYSSWPYWDFSNYPKYVYIKKQVVLWEKFLKGIQVVAVTDDVKKGLKKYTDNTTIIPHCINSITFTPSNRFNDSNIIRILYVGRLIPEKGVDIIIELIKDLRETKHIEWWFIGDGILRNEIIDLQTQFKNVSYLGLVKDQTKLAKLYQQCDILLLPSYSVKGWEELFGIVLIEAMACGVVPISTVCVGPKTIITDENDGFLVPIGDKTAFKKKIEYLTNNNEVLKRMASEARKTAEKRYSIEITASLWEDVLIN